MVRNKEKTWNISLLLPLKVKALLHSIFPSSTSVLLPVAWRAWSMGEFGQSLAVPCCHSFFLKLFLAPAWVLHRLQFFKINLLQHGSSMGCGSFGAYPPAPEWDPPQAAVWISAPVWSPPQAAGESLLWCSPSSLTLVSAGCFSHFPSLLTLLCSTLPFLKHVSPEVPPAWLTGSAVSCSGSVGAGCDPHGAAPHLVPEGPPWLPKSCPQTPDKRILTFPVTFRKIFAVRS